MCKCLKRIQFFLFILCANLAFSQDFKSDIQEIFNVLDSTESASLEVEVELFNSKNGKLVFSTESSMHYNQDASITVVGDMETYRSSSHEIVIDHEEKKVLIHKRKGKDFKISKGELKEIKKLLDSESNSDSTSLPNFELASNINGIRVYTCSNIEGIEEVTFTLDIEAKRIVSVIYEYATSGPYKGQYCVLTYNKFDLSPDFKSNFFSRSNYYAYSSGSYQLRGNFSEYKLFVE